MSRTRSAYGFALFSIGVGFAQAPVAITLTPSAVSMSAGKPLTFHVTAGQTTKRVMFFDRATILGTAAVNGQGEASFSTAWLAAGQHQIYAVAPGGVRSEAAQITIERVASSSFGTAKHYAAGLAPNAMAIADFNGDGHLDIALAGASGINVLPGHGDGTFGNPLPTAAAFQPAAIAAADFDGDGLMDLAVTDGTTGKIYFLRGAGNGTFAAPRVIATAINPVALAVGDFNGDGIADLAIADQASRTVLLLLGVGDGSFRAPLRIEAGAGPAALAVGDFNSDGIADLAVANFGANDVTILLGKGDGTFSSGVPLKVGNGPAAMLMSDLNGDGMEDLAVLNRLDATATVFYGKGDGTFQSGISLPAGSTPTGIAASDPNKDGFRALLVADGSKLRWQQLTAKSAQPVVQIDAGAAANGIAVGDFTGDGRSGVVTSAPAGVVWRPRAPGSAFSIKILGCPATVSPGQQFSCTVGAYDVDSDPAEDFTDTVQFTSSDGSATLPGDAALPSPASFNFTLQTVGPQSLTAADIDSDLSGGAVPASVTVLGATHFSVSATTPVTAGSNSTVVVTALDVNNDTFSAYAGTVQITSSDGQAVLPSNSGLSSGVGTFMVTLKTAGTRTVTATDTDTVSSITGTSNSITVNPTFASNITTTGGSPQSATVGTAFATPLQITARDQYNNLVNNVEVTFSSLGGGHGATFSPATVFTNSSGIASTIATANHIAGSYTVRAGGDFSTTFSLTNNPGPAASLVVAVASSEVAAGTSFNVTITALDQYGNLATGYTGTIHFSSTDVNPTLPGPVTLSSGSSTFQAVLRTAGTQTITVTDVGNSLSGTSESLTVVPGYPGIIRIVRGGSPQSTVVGTAFAVPLQVVVLDFFENPVNGLTVTYHVPSSGASAALSSPTAVTNALGQASVTAMANLAPGSYAVTPTVFAPAVNSPKLQPRGQPQLASFSLTNLPNVTVQTSPPGLAFSVDGISYTTPQNLGFALDSFHTIAVASPQTGPGSLQYGFVSWSDKGAASHMIIATATAVSYTATLGTLYPLTTSASPAAGGTVTPASGHLYGAGASVPLVAVRNTGYRFDHWSGAAADRQNADTFVVMNGPEATVATFILVNGRVSPAALNLQYSPGAPTYTATGTLSVTTADASAFSVTAADAWLTVSSSSNTTPATVTVTPNVAGMKLGTYNSSLSFTFSDGSVTAIPVTLTILEPQLLWTATPAGPLNFTAPSGATTIQSPEIIVSAAGQNVPLQVTASVTSPTAGRWLALSPDGKSTGTTPQAFHVSINPSGLAAGVYQGAITATSSAPGVSPLNIPLTLTITAATAAPPAISISLIQNAASFEKGSEAPNTILTAFGVYPGCTSGAEVSVDGSPTTVFYSSPKQVNFLFPSSVSGETSASLQIQCAGLKSPVFDVPVLNLAPAIFTVGQNGTGQAAIVNPDGSMATAATPGSIIQIYGTGFGMLGPVESDGLRHLLLPVTATIGGMPATVLFAGEASGTTTGLQQINVEIPANAPAGPAIPLQLTVGGVNTAAGVTLAIQ
jgi:uncharacterized protein (TIGR03437 family)